MKSKVEILEYLTGSLGIALVCFTVDGKEKTMTVQAFKKKYEQPQPRNKRES